MTGRVCSVHLAVAAALFLATTGVACSPDGETRTFGNSVTDTGVADLTDNVADTGTTDTSSATADASDTEADTATSQDMGGAQDSGNLSTDLTVDSSSEDTNGPGSDSGEDAPVDLGPPPMPEQLAPCEAGTCWGPSAEYRRCGYFNEFENFRTGNYNVHRYATQFFGGTESVVALTRTGGEWQPALVIVTQAGETIFDGRIGLQSEAIFVEPITTGQSGDTSEVRVVTSADLDVDVFVTGWSAVDSGFVDFLSTTATYRFALESVCDTSSDDGLAPDDTVPDATDVAAEATSVPVELVDDVDVYFRVDARQGEYVGFWLDFSPGGAAVELEVLRWNGVEPYTLGTTSGGDGLRVLSVVDRDVQRTFWVRIRGAGVSEATLQLIRTDFPEGPNCESDSDRLLQLPLPNDPIRDGYDVPSPVTFREQFGRRDILMYIRYAATVMAAAHTSPFTMKDLSNWDGTRPPGHSTHTEGLHSDISLYTDAGQAVWRSLCNADAHNECIPGTDHSFGEVHMARMMAALFESERIVWALLDREYHESLRGAVDDLIEAGEIDESLRWYFSEEAGIVRHVQSHQHHLHLKVSDL